MEGMTLGDECHSFFWITWGDDCKILMISIEGKKFFKQIRLAEVVKVTEMGNEINCNN